MLVLAIPTLDFQQQVLNFHFQLFLRRFHFPALMLPANAGCTCKCRM